jgi:hypothetical protein
VRAKLNCAVLPATTILRTHQFADEILSVEGRSKFIFVLIRRGPDRELLSYWLRLPKTQFHFKQIRDFHSKKWLKHKATLLMVANASIDQWVQLTNSQDLHRDTNRMSAGQGITHLGKVNNWRHRNPGNMCKGKGQRNSWQALQSIRISEVLCQN